MPRTAGLSEAEIQERWNQIIDLARRGVPPQGIAERIHVSAATVYRVMAGAGLATPRRPRLSVAELARAEAMIDDGCSLREVARTLGCDPTSIWRRFRGRGWTSGQRVEWQAMMRQAARELGL